MNITDFKEMTAMLYYDRPDDKALSDKLLEKKYNMIHNRNHEYMATQKWDGYWMMFYKGQNENEIIIRGRNKNKMGVYENYADKVPHLVEEMKSWPCNTVILGEICWPDLGKVATDVGVILRCLPAKARDRQTHKKLIVKTFDALMINGNDLTNNGYEIRFAALTDFIEEHKKEYFSITDVSYDEEFLCFADSIISKGGEGCVIQKKDHPYEPGKRSAWQTLKLKQKLPVNVYKVVSFLEPNKNYEGKNPEIWDYWEETNLITKSKTVYVSRPSEELFNNTNFLLEPVTKPYALGWKVGVTIELPSGKTCDVSSGLTDADREWCSTDEARNLLEQGELSVYISAMQEATLGGLRHPVFKGWEYNKDSKF